jgi:hypothetical protein
MGSRTFGKSAAQMPPIHAGGAVLPGRYWVAATILVVLIAAGVDFHH